ncbi:hypothetical protein AP75_02395 [Kaistella haifensis DSM 19056]|uniref:Uncharacterized protein n=1 Tax=Kaistella haifensis DSM 19056 TaxID=1450526 RepID=A0A246BD93_9FLAO|nr:hypothetical protein AP75_02395 [Kaistella haifensis DSM 19056]
MKFLIILFSIILFLKDQQSNVFICKGKNSERYHLKKSCRGLSKCSTDIHTVTIAEAREKGRTLCKWED